MNIQGPVARGTSHTEYSPAFTSRPSSTASRLKLTRVAESAPGCHTAFHFTSPESPYRTRPRATGRPYTTEMSVNATVWSTRARWLNGKPCACPAIGAESTSTPNIRSRPDARCVNETTDTSDLLVGKDSE